MTEEEMNELNRQLRALTQQQNEAAHPDFDGLSPAKMHRLNHQPLREGSVVRWQENIPQEKLEAIPLLNLVLVVLERLAEKEMKLTATGNLPRKFVHELYAYRYFPSEYVDSGLVKIQGENDWLFAALVKHLLLQLKWTKKRLGKLSLTAKGKKVLKGPRQQLLEELFFHHFQGFNLGYADGYPDDGLSQTFTGFLLYQFLLHGREWQPFSFYSDAMVKAFPMLPEPFGNSYSTPEKQYADALNSRYLMGFLHQYGLTRLRGEYKYNQPDTREVMATDLFRSLFRLDQDAQRPEQPGDVDKQIKSALFDAEMGGVSWTSNDMPAELQDIFQEQVRAFHGKGGGEPVTVGSVVADLNFPDPDTIGSEDAALDALQNVLTALMERGVVFEPPYHVPPEKLYRFVIEDLFAHTIPPPSPMIPIFVPFEEVETELDTEAEATAEAFLIAMFTLEEPLPEDLFDEPMRLRDEMVSRDTGMAYAEAWRDQFSAIRPVFFAPGPKHQEKGFVYQFIQVAYEVDRKDGSSEKFDVEGVIQLGPRKDGLKVVGGTFGEFAF
jgi:hypothetical protein